MLANLYSNIINAVNDIKKFSGDTKTLNELKAEINAMLENGTIKDEYRLVLQDVVSNLRSDYSAPYLLISEDKPMLLFHSRSKRSMFIKFDNDGVSVFYYDNETNQTKKDRYSINHLKNEENIKKMIKSAYIYLTSKLTTVVNVNSDFLEYVRLKTGHKDVSLNIFMSTIDDFDYVIFHVYSSQPFDIFAKTIKTNNAYDIVASTLADSIVENLLNIKIKEENVVTGQ
ncbi:MAG: hypothetical protein QXF12_05995 [Candidatus Aenigmatarchaeota archaeon]